MINCQIFLSRRSWTVSFKLFRFRARRAEVLRRSRIEGSGKLRKIENGPARIWNRLSFCSAELSGAVQKWRSEFKNVKKSDFFFHPRNLSGALRFGKPRKMTSSEQRNRFPIRETTATAFRWGMRLFAGNDVTRCKSSAEPRRRLLLAALLALSAAGSALCLLETAHVTFNDLGREGGQFFRNATPSHFRGSRFRNVTRGVLRLAVIAPIDADHDQSLRKILPAIRFAVDAVTHPSTGTLPGWDIQVNYMDSNCSSIYGPLAAVEIYMRGIAGTFRSFRTLPTDSAF